MRHRDEPLDESEAIRTLRAELRRVTEALETLLADGFPMRPMSSSRAGWTNGNDGTWTWRSASLTRGRR